MISSSMTEQQGCIAHDRSSYDSSKYWCSSCKRQFSQLIIDDDDEQVHCPRCASPARKLSTTHISANSSPNIRQSTRRSNNTRSNNQPNLNIPTPISNNASTQTTNPSNNTSLNNRSNLPQGFLDFYTEIARVPMNSSVERNNNIHHLNPNNQQQRQQQQYQQIAADLRRAFNLMTPLAEDLFDIPEFLLSPLPPPLIFQEVFIDLGNPNEHGAPKEAINKLQRINFHTKEGAEVVCCPICFEDYKEGESLVRLPCKHDYHNNCLNPWLTKHNSCPVCRKSI